MAINFSNQTISTYLERLSRKEPVPGGGSAAALTAALGVGLLSMVAQYSLGRKSNTKAVDRRLQKISTQCVVLRKRLLTLTSLDAKAYLGIVQARQKDIKAQQKASRYAKQVPQEVCHLSFKAIQLAPFLVQHGNPFLLSDIEVAMELLLAGFNGARVMVRINS